MGFFMAREDDIKKGKTTDVYFVRTEKILKEKNVHNLSVAEFTVSGLPNGYRWALFGGLEEAVELLKGKNIDLYAFPEGTLFKPRDINGVLVPVMYIVGDYVEFAIYETPTLGFLCQTSGIMTKSARVRLAAGDSVVLSFGIRRMHPALAPMIDRAAYIGGCDGVSSLIGAETINQPAKGTMPHALMITMGEDEAWKAYDELMPPEVPRIALIDTFGDEKYEAIKAAKIFRKLQSVRLDTPGSRRGNFAAIIREVRWELDVRGYKDVGIFVSGGLDEKTIPELKEAGANGFGVGTSISNAPTIDFAMDIVEIDGKPSAKKGKFGGRKDTYRCKECFSFVNVKHGENPPERCPVCGGELEPMHRKILDKGKLVYELPGVEDMRNYVLSQLEHLKKVEENPI